MASILHNSIIESISDDEYPVNYDCVDDDRMRVLNVGSQYCDLQGINGSLEIFSISNYCALHINIHSLPSKLVELRNILCNLKENNITIHLILLCEIT